MQTPSLVEHPASSLTTLMQTCEAARSCVVFQFALQVGCVSGGGKYPTTVEK